MTAKAYLQQIYWLQIKIKQKSAELEELRLSASGFKGVDYTADKVQCPPKDRMAEMVGALADLEAETMQMIVSYHKQRDRIINEIHSLPDSRYIELLYKRYVEFKQFNRIAKEMHYDYKYLSWLHRRALQAFDRIVIKPTSRTITN